MESNIGKLTATLSASENNKIDSLLEILHTNIRPSMQLTADDIHIRCMYIVSEELNSYGGKFPIEELHQIKELIVDSPVLVGHKKDQLPIGRNFHSEIVIKDDTNWVKSYFYWMKSAEHSEELQKNIDGGVIKECSIGFTFLTPECSICGADIRTCRHEPLMNYDKDGITQSCYFYYKHIEKVLETSLVYRGAIPNTSISNELLNREQKIDIQELEVIYSLDALSNNSSFMITPRYIGIDVLLTTTQNSIQIKPSQNKPIPKHLIKKYFFEYPKNLTNLQGQLIGYRGKERCSLEELHKFILGEKSIVKRIELRLYPSHKILKSNYHNMRVMRYRIGSKNEINSLSKSIMTKDGVQLWEFYDFSNYKKSILYKPNCNIHENRINTYHITYDSDKNLVLSLITHDSEIRLSLKNFSQSIFGIGKKFLAEKNQSMTEINNNKTKYNSGDFNIVSSSNNHMQLIMNGVFDHKISIQPIILNGKDQFLIYKSV